MDTVLRVLRGIFGWLASKLSALFGWVVSRVRGKRNYIAPKQVIRKACIAADETFADWPDDNRYPDMYTVEVDQTSWSQYYCGDKDFACKQIESALRTHIGKRKGSVGRLVVNIQPNAALELGDVTVDCSFMPSRVLGIAEAPIGGATVTFGHDGKQSFQRHAKPVSIVDKAVHEARQRGDMRIETEKERPVGGEQRTVEEAPYKDTLEDPRRHSIPSNKLGYDEVSASFASGGNGTAIDPRRRRRR